MKRTLHGSVKTGSSPEENFTGYITHNSDLERTPEPVVSSHVFYKECFGEKREFGIHQGWYSVPVTDQSKKYPQPSDHSREDVHAADFYYICRQGYLHTLMQCVHCLVIAMGAHDNLFHCPECHGSDVRYFKMSHRGQDSVLLNFFRAVRVLSPRFWQLVIDDQVVEVWITDYDTDLDEFQQLTRSLFHAPDDFSLIYNSTECHLPLRKREAASVKGGAERIELMSGDIPITGRRAFDEFRRSESVFRSGTPCVDSSVYGKSAECTPDGDRTPATGSGAASL